MVVLKPHVVGVLLLAASCLLLGNKGCKHDAYTWQHPEASRSDDCSECHEAEEGIAVNVKPLGHDIAWERNHGKLMQRFGAKPSNSCSLCHAQSTCTSCHQQQAPTNHNQFFRLRGHGLQAAMDRNSCATCHQSGDFCSRCHATTRPLDHNAQFGAPNNRHCVTCHFPLNSAGAQRCSTCHRTAIVHQLSVMQPANNLHIPGADCRGCHVPLKHPDNGMRCTDCHARP